MTRKDRRIAYYRNLATNKATEAHQIGETKSGKRLFSFQEGYAPENSAGQLVFVRCDRYGNWIEQL